MMRLIEEWLFSDLPEEDNLLMAAPEYLIVDEKKNGKNSEKEMITTV